MKINPVQNVGIESLKIKRIDATSTQTSSVFFNYAINCWVKGVEFENSNFLLFTMFYNSTFYLYHKFPVEDLISNCQEFNSLFSLTSVTVELFDWMAVCFIISNCCFNNATSGPEAEPIEEPLEEPLEEPIEEPVVDRFSRDSSLLAID